MAKARREFEELREFAKLQAEIDANLQNYIEAIKNINLLQKDINTIEKNITELTAEKASLANSTLAADKDRVKVIKKTLKLLEAEKNLIESKRKNLVEAVKQTNKLNMLGGQIAASTIKTAASLEKIPTFIGNITNKFKDLFEMDKSIRRAGLQMGLIGSQSEVFRKNIKLAAADTQKLGMGIKELAEMQAQYSENIGRNVSLGKQDLVALSEIAQGTALGAEATGQMAADFEAQGISATRTRDAIEEAANRASAMGLNSAKVIKNIAQNTKMLNKFRFKDGVKGLVKMSELSAKLGVDMEFASGFAEKLFNVEGAVETAAQFNVMGGAFARLGDPFKLMYMARNDIAGLTEELAKAASESATFNKETGKFELGAMEMHRLRIIAEQTGLEYDKLVTAGQNAAKFSKIRGQVSFDMDEESRQFLENTAQFDKNGKAYITIDGEKKFLNMLGSSAKSLISTQVKEKKRLEERAKAALSFDEQITNLINMVKTFMLPIVEGMTDVLKPLVEKFMDDNKLKTDLKNLGENIGKFVEWGAKGLKWFTETIVDTFGVNGIFAAWLGGKGLLMLFDGLKWVANGLALSKGFLMGTKGFPGGGSGQIGGSMFGSRNSAAMTRAGLGTASKIGVNFKSGLKSFGAIGGGLLAGGIEGYDEYSEQMEKGKSQGEAIGRAALKGTGAGLGAWGGAAAGAAIGSVVPVVGTLIGGLIGGALGAWGGGKIADLDTYGVNDGLFKGSGNDRRAILQKGRITPIDKKDDVLAMKPNGIVDKMMNQQKAGSQALTKIEFDELKITGEIKIMLPDGTNIGRELMKNPEFKTSITRVVISQLDKNVNGGKNKP